MGNLLIISITFSLIITAIHVSLWQGMLLGYFRIEYLDRFCPKILRKPFYECLPCMASLWTIVLSWLSLGYLSLDTITILFIVCGINVIIESILNYSQHNPLNK